MTMIDEEGAQTEHDDIGASPLLPGSRGQGKGEFARQCGTLG